VGDVLAARKEDRVQEREPKHRRQGADALVGIDPGQDGVQAEELAGCVQIDELVDERVSWPRGWESPAHLLAHFAAGWDGLGQMQVAGYRIGSLKSGAAQLFVARCATVLTGNGS
jgi:hypothetical protein